MGAFLEALSTHLGGSSSGGQASGGGAFMHDSQPQADQSPGNGGLFGKGSLMRVEEETLAVPSTAPARSTRDTDGVEEGGAAAAVAAALGLPRPGSSSGGGVATGAAPDAVPSLDLSSTGEGSTTLPDGVTPRPTLPGVADPSAAAGAAGAAAAAVQAGPPTGASQASTAQAGPAEPAAPPPASTQKAASPSKSSRLWPGSSGAGSGGKGASGSAASKGGGLVGDLRPHIITNVSTSTRTAALMKDSLLEATKPKDRPFVKAFVDTQMFQVREGRRGAGCFGRGAGAHHWCVADVIVHVHMVGGEP